MNETTEYMNEKEFKSIFMGKLFNKIDKMIGEKNLPMENAILEMKSAGRCKALKRILLCGFEKISLGERIEKMIVEENLKKKEEKNEKFLVDLCECYISLRTGFPPELLLICVPCLLKAASDKEETEEIHKDVEMALFALCCIEENQIFEQKQYLKEMLKIIKIQQEHHNLMRLTYQSAWMRLINKFFWDKSVEDMIVNELHFPREAEREQEESKKVMIIRRWLSTIKFFISLCQLRNEEFVELIGEIVQVFRVAKDNYREIHSKCIYSLREAAAVKAVEIEDLLNGGAFDAVLEEFQRQTLNDDIAHDSLIFLMNVSNRLKEEDDDEKEEVKRKATKRKPLEKMEEEGYEDRITSLYGEISFINERYNNNFSLNISEYFVNI
ncbi:uncharacterized protein MONOS_15712 [Monocercomonoides exilis]|uniref:uncharacterized protein n=1 Tax=Monocercomonoides exilis TaxID=2049356 RepID=UPI00355950A9|nr:hypothetical protein MONOS_15712 [Monocercomonoides exilis]|eukprot:MONOS_15712.1-p1 / transcript=MONOS_15712.1 / gene=MONOS_15712 / organism=Monocercomonoides_exilis_PA203 / gene_product=unspecified product / transcript_product=unspecified product / location=Mono_scaffold01321:7030-8236(-) / protein_length=383 / sequence_SO=supercontig / SO=protein_coding / is_pseudo=false